MRKLIGRISTSRPSSTSGPIHTSDGSVMVTPASMWRWLMRACRTFAASASCTREFTPSVSSGSSVDSAETSSPSALKTAIMSVR